MNKMVSYCEEMIANCFGIYNTKMLELGGKLLCVCRKNTRRSYINQRKMKMTSLKWRMTPILSDYTVPCVSPN